MYIYICVCVCVNSVCLQTYCTPCSAPNIFKYNILMTSSSISAFICSCCSTHQLWRTLKRKRKPSENAQLLT